jgi:GrpB-like predicted nucleotidyltransferase (UPF0157 family)
MRQRESVIGLYSHKPAEIQPYEWAYPEVARYVAGLIRAELDCVKVEHIGSTAIEGCAGKGIIDLMVLYPKGFLKRAKEVLSLLGFQNQPHKDPFPENRPMRVGSVAYKGRVFQIHVHVIQQGDAEAIYTLKFRDALRADKVLMQEYVACKKHILQGGITDSVEYCRAKQEFIAGIMKAER